ncbi:MAG TPA: hypothetical protein VGH98_10635 [Gemmatimonadaceae bacterium]|jgi:Spy/CpxP family protein refolding chaperone
MSESSPVQRTRLLAGFVLVAVFVGGAVAGATVEHLRASAAPQDAPTPVASTDQVIANMKMAGTGIPVMYEALDLSPEQRAQIATILASYQPRVDSLLHDRWPALHAVIDSVRLRVEQVLTPAQQRRLTTMRRSEPPR